MASSQQHYREPPMNSNGAVTTDVDPPLQSSCPECGGHVTEEGHEQVCTDCGLVVDETHAAVDHGPEWRNFGDSPENPARASPINHRHHDNGMGTAGFRADGGTLQERRMQKLQGQAQTKDHRERNLRNTLGDIQRAGSALEVADPVVDTACTLFKKFHGDSHQHGHDLDRMGAAVVYAACRIHNAGITPRDVEKQFDLECGWVFKEVKRLSKTVDVPIPTEKPGDYVPRFVSELGGGASTEQIARQLAAEVEECADFVGHKPSGLAAAIVYKAFRDDPDVDKRTQKAISEISDTSPPTIRNNWNKIEESGIESEINTGLDGDANE